MEEGRVLNVNVGILGHIDSGKTAIARSLSTLLSTASLDRSPQSSERGITLDLGFSAFSVPLPPSLSSLPYLSLQVTLVDCPGHASLIRTVLGGAQIIDMMILVVDVTKGVQTQTAECLVVGEVSATKEMLVVLNKTDLLPEATRQQQIEKMKKRLKLTLKGTKFCDSSILATSARPGGTEGDVNSRPPEGIENLAKEITSRVKDLKRSGDGPFLFAVDHCFPIKGQGSVMTGTILDGKISVNQILEIPSLKIQRKVKSMQMFHRPVSSAMQGDRVAICVTQLDPKMMERGLAAVPGLLRPIRGAVAKVQKIRFYKGRIGGKIKFHVTVGHTTVMAEATFFGPEKKKKIEDDSLSEKIQEEPFSFDNQYCYQEELEGGEEGGPVGGAQWALLTFETEVICPKDALLIASRLDTDIHSNTCRLAFHGRLLETVDPSEKKNLEKLQIYKMKKREGAIERIVDSFSLIGRGLFKKETDISQFLGLQVSTATGEIGVIQSSFGKSGKFKVYFKNGDLLGKERNSKLGENILFLNFKRFLFDRSKKMVQDPV